MTFLPLPRTYRMRMMVLSVSLSAAILLGFGGWCWRLLYSYTSLDRLDAEMRVLARNQLVEPRPDEDWSAFQDALDYLSALDPARQFTFVVLDRSGHVVFQDDHWPAAIAPDTLVDVAAVQLPAPPPGLPGLGADGRPPGLRGPRGEPRGQEPNAQRRGGGGRFGGDRDGPRPGGPDDFGPGRRGGPPPRVSVEVVELALITRLDESGAWRMAVMGNPLGVLVLGADLSPYYAEANALQNAFIVVLIVALLAVGAGSWFLAQRALRPVARLASTAESITAQALDRRIPEVGESEEFARLNRVFNAMLERLDRSFQQANRFSADAAHELKTPLTILQGQLNQLLQEAPPGSSLQQELGRLLEEVQRLTVIIRKLLLLSLADAGHIKLNLAPVEMDAFMEPILEDGEILAPTLELKHDLASGIRVRADEALLRQAVQNLVNNAIKYNVPKGKIRVELFALQGKARLTVANTSAGIPEEERKRVFHRFYRADPAHSRQIDGVGLGLSLAREIVRSHGGKLWLASAPEGWVMFIIELPLSEDSAVEM